MNSQDASNISNQHLSEHGTGHQDLDRGPPDKINTEQQMECPPGVEEGGSEPTSGGAGVNTTDAPVDEQLEHKKMALGIELTRTMQAMKQDKKSVAKTKTSKNGIRKPDAPKRRATADGGEKIDIDEKDSEAPQGTPQVIGYENQSNVEMAEEEDDDDQDVGQTVQQAQWEVTNEMKRVLKAELRTELMAELKTELKNELKTELKIELTMELKEAKNEIRYLQDLVKSRDEEVATLRKTISVNDMEHKALKNGLREVKDENVDTVEELAKLRETVDNKTREFGDQARMSVAKAHRAQQAAEEAKVHVEKTAGKIEELAKQYEDKLGKTTVALQARLDRSNGDVGKSIDKITKDVETWKKEIAVSVNKIKQAEVKVTATANTQKQFSERIDRQIDGIKQYPWITVAQRKTIEVIGEKAAVQLKQPPIPVDTYRIRILDPTDLEEQKEAPVEKYADELCSMYKDEKFPVRRIWRTGNGNVTIVTDSKKVFEEREEWIKKLNPEFQLIQEENWPKLVVKGIKTGTPEEIVRKDLEKSLGVKFKTDPIRIGTNHTILGDTYVLSFKTEEDKFDAQMQEPIVRYNRAYIYEYTPRTRGNNNGRGGLPRGPARSSYEAYSRQKAAAAAVPARY